MSLFVDGCFVSFAIFADSGRKSTTLPNLLNPHCFDCAHFGDFEMATWFGATVLRPVGFRCEILDDFASFRRN